MQLLGGREQRASGLCVEQCTAAGLFKPRGKGVRSPWRATAEKTRASLEQGSTHPDHLHLFTTGLRDSSTSHLFRDSPFQILQPELSSQENKTGLAGGAQLGTGSSCHQTGTTCPCDLQMIQACKVESPCGLRHCPGSPGSYAMV